MATENTKSDSFDKLVTILVSDFLNDCSRLKLDDTPSVRRSVIRCGHSAIEGSLWMLRLHVSSVADSVGEMTPSMAVIFSEKTYALADTGKLRQQPSYFSILSMFRFTIRVAQKIDPNIHVDLSGSDWQNFKLALDVRNRITHPKFSQDLEIADHELARTTATVLWVLRATAQIMESTTASLKRHIVELRDVLVQLEAGNEDMMKLYQNAL
jgi:hypothetical protein